MKYFLFPFFYFLFCSPTESKSANIESIVSFGDSLFLKGNYINALNEYRRAYFFAGSELKSQLGGKIADCYLILNDFKMARSFYDSVMFYSKNDSQRISCEFQKILCFMKENNFGYALIKLNNLEVEDEIQLQRRKNLYQGICYFGMEQYDSSHLHFLKTIPSTDTLGKLQLQKMYENTKMLKRPNPCLAILFSIIVPGAGQIYSGDLKDGLNSALLLGGLFYLGSSGSLSSFIAIMPFFYRYYMGGIMNAKQIADKRKKEKQYYYYTNLMQILLQ